MTGHFREVRPEDFDVEALYAASREGRLFLFEKNDSEDRDGVRGEVRVYIERIRVYVTKEYQATIDALWKAILDSDDFISILLPNRRARICKTFNKYSVMRIIGVLRELGVYKQYSDRKFDALLEPKVQDSPYRRYLSVGLEEVALLKKARELVAKYKL